MTTTSGRRVTALVTAGDQDLGAVGPFDVVSPWWSDVEPVVAHLRGTLGVNVAVLRLVDVDGGTAPRGGHVTYHVEALETPAEAGAAQAAIAARRLPPPSVVPYRRPAFVIGGMAGLLAGEAGAQLTTDEMAGARALERRLPTILAELAACGLPDTLVHGDFHPGNWRSDGGRPVLIDFADAYVGHPVFDAERLRAFVEAEHRPAVVDAWCAAWSEHLPRSDPLRALRLAQPLQALSGAIAYQMFLDHIEASERRYHDGDPAAGIRDAISSIGKNI